jgi:hypothetical protein
VPALERVWRRGTGLIVVDRRFRKNAARPPPTKIYYGTTSIECGAADITSQPFSAQPETPPNAFSSPR